MYCSHSAKDIYRSRELVQEQLFAAKSHDAEIIRDVFCAIGAARVII